MAFTAADVKNLREMNGVGMMDCKKALVASDGDMDKPLSIRVRWAWPVPTRRSTVSRPR